MGGGVGVSGLSLGTPHDCSPHFALVFLPFAQCGFPLFFLAFSKISPLALSVLMERCQCILLQLLA